MADVALPNPIAISRPQGASYRFYYLAIAAAAAVLFVLELGIGSVYIPLSDVVRLLSGGEASRQVWEPIVLQFRLPRALNAAISGAALGVCGLLLQTLIVIRWPIRTCSESFTAGVSGLPVWWS
jgi:iron complex transport system permease protein